ncbi:MAG: DUF5995 family protein [Altibacter sp.]|uniref:DUF5995 family protein n=1 Tax=Altibacter sp. TaxID=2024823 RepID=UPI001DE15B47|nr:DUF5995 family protein [Altibacter sp.]MBZ0327928.1 DUF5995 family protein [Altibacter sp.]
MNLATTIDEVIYILNTIITTETQAGSNLAFFPVLYKKVTERIKIGIEANEFENNARMEQLDVLFANRYLESYRQFKAKEKPTASWACAFEAAGNSKLLIMQQLLLGINAHINLDLGIAVAETVGEQGNLTDFENDFNKINAILASMVADVEDRISKVSPMFLLLDKVGKGKEDKVVSFSINVARDGAWLFANQYYFSGNKPQEIDNRDTIIAALATKLTTTKNRWLRYAIRFIRFFEMKNVAKVSEILDN